MQFFLLLALILLSAVAYYLGRKRALTVAGGQIRNLHSLPSFYGSYTALWCGLPALAVLALWAALQPDILTNLVVADLPTELRDLPPDQLNLVVNNLKNLVSGHFVSSTTDPAMQAAAERYQNLRLIGNAALWVVALSIAMGGIAYAWRRIAPTLRARNSVESVVTIFLIASSTVAIFTTIGIILSVVFESLLFFRQVPVSEFLFGLQWSPQTALRADQIGSSGAFGAVPLFGGTLLISGIAMLVAVPIGLMSALYLSEYATPKFRAFAKPALEILAGIPTVVYGFFAALTVAPLIREIGTALGLHVASESALAAGLVMGIMIIPFVSSLSDDVINAVPQSMRDGSYALGATKSETITRVLLPAALPGIVGSILLAVSRAIGETMIVVMAAGLSANLTANPLEAVTTVTVQIVTLLTGDQEFDSPKTLAAFALGLVLFVVTLILNIIALRVVRKYREQYE
ncbi:high-affinity phosphate transport protein (ABC superfamily, membrane) [Candidatus Competibacter denitrificans Run_A_D11]|uniref:Phosphate transport system permease protein n=1 Tax=Candidatus Competibacter denitrificans Run_A_D11 TaxID=1400863 RepID=W6M5M3_9GAMM|nr:phosphate ABC transporter permease subunit PstC [Candidatus Competibacter denitrificans]CDI03176.1 high-affinity phosphate transport protein (ABC superfamily, membrane) [Candidatus Competibacter denitrificans Run_A_D11]HAS87195.1 phosphate ABC transporter permease subunit PstC [Candidatus Competibacteraceae bacterium]HRC70886.1 phosphate ABC transporter permease subunit PstC [Candidatus Competibacter denitrificans]